MSSFLRALALILIFAVAIPAVARGAEVAHAPILSPRNTEAPFCYRHGSTRRWPILERKIPADTKVILAAKRGGETLSQGTALTFPGFVIALTPKGHLEIKSARDGPKLSFDLHIELRGPDGRQVKQTLEVRPAPPPRPLSYYADFGDDIIRIFFDSATGQYREITKSGFDQYFRRLQAQGISRLIIWLTPFPYIADRANYAPEDWEQYERQARAILECESLTAVLNRRKRYTSWGWIRQLTALRLMPGFGKMVTRSAAEHEIALTISFRPFEAALTKYYEIPAFDTDGTFLWGFLPMASPVVNSHADKACFVHYRKILTEMGHADAGTLSGIDIEGAVNAAAFVERFGKHRDNLRIVAAGFPPLQDDSFVLHRQADGGFRLRPFSEIRKEVESRLRVVTDFEVRHDGSGRVEITGVNVPDRYRFLILTNPSGASEAIDLSTHKPVALRSKTGARLGRENVYWVLNGSDEQRTRTRVGGITASGGFHTEFQAIEGSHGLLVKAPERRPLRGDAVVIDRGAPWSVEMIDFNQPAARRNTVAELKTVLAFPAVDEIFINTRSHVQLAASTGDGELGVQPILHYRAKGKNYMHLGIDRAYAPRSVAGDPKLAALASNPDTVEQITTWQPGAWQGPCQSEASSFRWRYARNRAVAAGVRKLLLDLAEAFPGVRTRVVIPESARVIEAVRAGLDTMPRPEGGVYGRNYYRHIRGSLNHIPAIGEGMTMVDLTGLPAEPVFLGVRYGPDPGPLRLFVDECLEDMADNRGSSFRGPRSFFYEAQETLRAKDREAARRRRERTICHLLSRKADVNEVILYEAADWTYYLPLSDPQLCGHAFLDRCGEILGAGDKP